MQEIYLFSAYFKEYLKLIHCIVIYLDNLVDYSEKGFSVLIHEEQGGDKCILSSLQSSACSPPRLQHQDLGSQTSHRTLKASSSLHVMGSWFSWSRENPVLGVETTVMRPAGPPPSFRSCLTSFYVFESLLRPHNLFSAFTEIPWNVFINLMEDIKGYKGGYYLQA